MENTKTYETKYDWNDQTISIASIDSMTEEICSELRILMASDFDIRLDINPSLDRSYGESANYVLTIKPDNILYPAFSNFLADDITITIKDDLGYQDFGKKLIISRHECTINLDFSYDRQDILNEFGVHIINVNYDLRSYCDQEGMDIKERLTNLYHELQTILKAFSPRDDIKKLTKIRP